MPHKVRVEEGARDSIPGDADAGGCGMTVGDCLIPSAEAEKWRELVDMVAGGKMVIDENCFFGQDLWAERSSAFCVTIGAKHQRNATPAGLRNALINLRTCDICNTGDITRMDLALLWRPFSSIDCGHPQGPPLSRVCCCCPAATQWLHGEDATVHVC